MDSKTIQEKDRAYIVNTYNRFDLCIEKGFSAACHTPEGKEYIDFTSGIGVNSLGFCNDEWSKAVAGQAHKLNHTSNLYYTAPDTLLAEKLCAISGMDKVFFTNSGAEANEGAIKIARKYSFDKHGGERNTIVTLVNSFHGRTITTLSATGQEHFHQFFFPFTEGFKYVEYGDLNAVDKILDETVCAVMIELVQGEGGVVTLDTAYVQGLARICREKDILLLVDEVQTGVGRTGSFFCYQQFGIKPDIVTAAKGLGGGLPIGAVLMNNRTSSVLGFGDHATTFGGNPIACAGANVVMDIVSKPEFLMEVKKKGERICKTLNQCNEVACVTGLGLMIGIELKEKKAADAVKACLEKGLMVLTAKNRLRLLPPLSITNKELDKGLSILKEVLQ